MLTHNTPVLSASGAAAGSSKAGQVGPPQAAPRAPPDFTYLAPMCAHLSDGDGCPTLMLYAAGTGLQPAASSECLARFKGRFLSCEALVLDGPAKQAALASGKLPASALAGAVDAVSMAIKVRGWVSGHLGLARASMPVLAGVCACKCTGMAGDHSNLNPDGAHQQHVQHKPPQRAGPRGCHWAGARGGRAGWAAGCGPACAAGA